VQVDISDAASVAAMARTAHETYGGVDILVNNAAMMAELDFAPAFMCKQADWNKILSVNLTGALLVSQAIVPMMQWRGGGKIVNQVSAGAFPAFSVYGITKLALVGLTTTLARELGPMKINVNAIAPGITLSDAGKALTPPDSPLKRMLENVIAMRVEGAPDELVGTLLLLCSPAGDWITGQVMHVDGGWVMRA
jgi:NAD(P)-dependent dehydrogenase (short-subunit alcohol dehydrogenase family)